MAINTVIRLEEAQTRDLLPLETRGPGVSVTKLLLEGNSLLSTVWVKSIDPGASVAVRYYDVTSGKDLGEEGTLPSHPLITTAGTDHNKITVTPFHNNPVLEVTVAGGSAEFSVWGTVVSAFATDIGAALVFDDSTFVPEVTKGIPIVCLDEDSGQLFFLRCEDGGLKVTGNVTIDETPGTEFYARGEEDADPGNTIDVVSFTVPASTTRKIRRLYVTAINDGDFSLQADGVEIAAGRIDVVKHNMVFVFDPPRPLPENTSVVLKYTADTLPSFNCPVTSFIMAEDF